MEFNEALNSSEMGQTDDKDINSEIPGLKELPPDTQEVVLESYQAFKEVHDTYNRHIEGCEEYIEIIPSVIGIIDKNIPVEQEGERELPPEKKQYIEDTVKLVKLCQNATSIDLELLSTKDQLDFYDVLDNYASTYGVEGITNQLLMIDRENPIREVREYYARNPQATLKRIQDQVLKREIPTLHTGWPLRRIADLMLRDYTFGSNDTKRTKYGDLLKELSDTCSKTSITDENFANTLETQTKEIEQQYTELLIDDKCQEEISRRTQVDFVTYVPIQKRFKEPNSEAKSRFSYSLSNRLNSISKTLVKDIENKEELANSKQLFIHNMPELNRIKEKITTSRLEYSQKLEVINNILPFGEVNTNNFNNLSRFERIVNDSTVREIEEELLKNLNSKDLLFHGTPPGESRLGVLTNGLMSKKKQEEILGWSRYNTTPHQRTEESMRKYISNESEMLYFAPNHSGAKQYSGGGFEVGIPEGLASRNYARMNAGVDEVMIFDRDNPGGGCIVRPEESFLFISQGVYNAEKNQYNRYNTNGEDFDTRVRKIWGDRLIISNETPPTKIENLNLPPVKNARSLPTKAFYTGKYGTKDRIYKTVYS